MFGLIGLVVFILDIIAIVDLFKSAADTGNKVLWLILILLFPVVGMVCYFLFGKKK
ncbi:MAG: PLD nuclease N-terminal domain-containing protein [Candidatus Omnitrophica bacterium]|nr:PLD nuclease N-terminal domain-containing protein [Candidatus Omnitrophota bacterium]